MNFKWDQVHEIAEQLEHIRSSELINRLDDFLGNPTIDPYGDPIPDENGQFQLGPSKLLSEMTSQENGIIIGVKNENSLLLRHLDKLKIHLGLHIEVIEVNDFDKSMQVKLANSSSLFLSEKIASQILIAKKNMILFLNTEKLFANLPHLFDLVYLLLISCCTFECVLPNKKYQYSLRWLLPFKYIEKSITEDLLKQLYNITSSRKTTDFRMLSGALKIPEQKLKSLSQ